MEAFVSQDVCTGCGVCIEVCPEVFTWDNEKAIAYTSPSSESEEKTCREAADSCPVGAIMIE